MYRRRSDNGFVATRAALTRTASVVTCAGVMALIGVSASAEGLRLELTMETPDVTLYEPVVADLTISNLGSTHERIDLGANGTENVSLWVLKEGGEPLVFNLDAPEEGLVASGKVSLGPGQVYAQRLVLNEWYAFDTVARYQISVHLDPAAVVESEAPKTSISGRVDLQISPRNEARLTDLAVSLLAETLAATDVTTAAENAKILSYILDPVVVPVLERLLSERALIRAIAIEGLVRLEVDQSVDALADNIGRFGEEADAMLVSGLHQIAVGATNPRIRTRARAVIGR